MITRFAFSFVFLFSCLFGQAPYADVLYNEAGAPSEALLEVLTANDIDHDGSWKTIVEKTQQKWLRKADSERWNLDPIEDKDKQASYGRFCALNMTQTVLPSSSQYDYVAIYGATRDKVAERLQFLAALWKQGVRFSTLVFLTGNRILDPKVDRMEGNETEMMKTLYKEADLPGEMRKLPLLVIDVPQKDGRRPTTIDTLVAFAKVVGTDKTVLFIASQPFSGRADSLARIALPNCNLETVGPGFSEKYYTNFKNGLAIILDELSRWLYTEYNRK